MNETEKKQTHRSGEQTSGYRWWRAGGEGIIGVGEKNGYPEIVWIHVWETFENCKAQWEFKESFIQLKKIKIREPSEKYFGVS